MLDILTITLGRKFYFFKLLESIEKKFSNHFDLINHYLIFQNQSYDEETENFIKKLNPSYSKKINIEIIESAQSVGEVLNKVKHKFKQKFFLKLDDDCLLVSDDFGKHILALANQIPDCAFSPYPVGLINNTGGVHSRDHKIIYNQHTNCFYTLRKVNHLGGFARLVPTEYFKNIVFSDSHSEDSECSQYLNKIGVEMFYLENSIIVEHQESTYGQHARYGEGYFKGRF